MNIRAPATAGRPGAPLRRRCAACTATPATRACAPRAWPSSALGGVGSWAAEALARSGVAALVLIDLDHVAESQHQPPGAGAGPHAGPGQGAGAARARGRHPPRLRGARRSRSSSTRDNWPALLPHAVDAVIDACDQVRAKAAMAAWALAGAHAVRRRSARPAASACAQAVEVEDLAAGDARPAAGVAAPAAARASTAPRAQRPHRRCAACSRARRWPRRLQACAPEGGNDGSLNCHGYGSSVTVTATFGMVAAGEAIAQLLSRAERGPPRACRYNSRLYCTGC